MIYEPIRLRFAQLSADRAFLSAVQEVPTSRDLRGSASRSALRAQPPKNELAFANNPLPERARGRPGHVVPVHVLNIAAAVADEVVMPHVFRIEARGGALDGHF